MDSLTTHPATAQQAKAFTSPASLSFPGGAGELTPPSSSEKEANGAQQPHQPQHVNGSGPGGGTPATPVATPGAGPGVSGIVPTLQ